MGKAGLRKGLGVIAILGVAGGALAQTYYSPPAYPPAASPPPPPPSSYSPRPSADQCGSHDLQYLVGRPTTEIPIPVEPSRRRVVCTTCPMTQEHYTFRQTILFDPVTGLVTAVTCS
jgi:hypothetical protein